jgi:hypothetical protein
VNAPRLLTERAAAEYLSIPVAGVRRIAAGRVVLDGRVRWDRLALDEWLDAMRGRAPTSAANQNQTKADAALAEWLADQTNAARSS